MTITDPLVDLTNTNTRIMGPPGQIFVKGTKQFASAVESGQIQMSLPYEPRQDVTKEHTATCIVSPPTNMNNEIFNIEENYHFQQYFPHTMEGSADDFSGDDQQQYEHSRDARTVATFPSENDSSRLRKRKIDEIYLPSTRFSDIIGHHDVKLRMEEALLPFALPTELVETVLTGIRAMPTSILLFGPPGCGKTKLAQALAGHASAAFLCITPSDVLSHLMGESENSIRLIFERAYRQALQVESRVCVVFFDEIDALGQSRENLHGSGDGTACSRRVLAELLVHLSYLADSKNIFDGREFEEDGVVPEHNKEARLLVIAATNRRDDCDPALLRRFGTQLEVTFPTKLDRQEMIKQHLEGLQYQLSDEQLDTLSGATLLFSGSDMEQWLRDAAMAPIRECIHEATRARQRAAKDQQMGGVSSDQADSTKPIDPDVAAQKSLMNSFSNLRSVNYSDLVHAFNRWMKNRGDSLFLSA